MRFFGRNEVTGVDIGAGSIKVVRIENGKRPKLLSAELIELPLSQDDTGGSVAALASLVSEKKITGGSVVTRIPGRNLTIRHLTLPKMPPAELREAVRWESKRYISYPLETAIIEYVVVGEKLEGTVDKYDILIVAAPHSAVVEHLKPFADAGIKLMAADADALALRNVLRLRELQRDQNVLVADLGAGKTEINIFKNNNLRFSRCLETGGLEITRAISALLGIGLQEAEDLKMKTGLAPNAGDKVAALIRSRIDGIFLEIRRSVDYYKASFREQRVERAILTGGGSLMPGIVEHISDSFDGIVEPDDPFSAIRPEKQIQELFGPLAPRFSTAVGLALRRA
ncbi:MAG: hypothetical protein A2010_13015 [Nitrospirae bacterium GWD2_57_9]|nr:MAG: hypothetical protein A2010_13015 [Nitrospirae bacterium GWD2_57_9]